MEKLPRATCNLYGISLEINRGETRWYMKILIVENVREKGKRVPFIRCFGLADGETEIAEKCRTRRRRSRRRNRDKVDKVVHCLAYFRRNSMYEKLFF